MNTTSNEPYDFSGKTFYFGVETKYGKDLEKNIKYVISCNYKQVENNEFIVSIERKQFFIDGIEPQRLVDQFANACMEIMYPIKYRVTQKGSFIEFKGFKALRKRMQEGVPKIRQQYKGEQVNEYLQQIGNSLADKEKFSKALLNDPLYHLLFMNLFMSKEEVVMSFPAKSFKSPEKFYGITKAIEVKNNMSGIIFKGETFKKERIEITKWLNNDDHSLQKINVITEDALGQDKVSYTVIRLKEREEESSNSSFYLEEEEEEIKVAPKKKKKKWLFF